MTPREVIAEALHEHKHRFPGYKGRMRDGTATPDQILEAFAAAGFTVVPVEPTEEGVNAAYKAIFPNESTPEQAKWFRVREGLIRAAQGKDKG